MSSRSAAVEHAKPRTVVHKFGGTSVADLDRIRNAAQKVKREVERGYDVIVIVSAMSGKTNELVGWVEGTSKFYDAREYDAVVASGENVTAGLMALRLQEMGIPARSWQGWQVPINTTAQHGAARKLLASGDDAGVHHDGEVARLELGRHKGVGMGGWHEDLLVNGARRQIRLR